MNWQNPLTKQLQLIGRATYDAKSNTLEMRPNRPDEPSTMELKGQVCNYGLGNDSCFIVCVKSGKPTPAGFVDAGIVLCIDCRDEEEVSNMLEVYRTASMFMGSRQSTVTFGAPDKE